MQKAKHKYRVKNKKDDKPLNINGFLDNLLKFFVPKPKEK